jgi:hypothetical protein
MLSGTKLERSKAYGAVDARLANETETAWLLLAL